MVKRLPIRWLLATALLGAGGCATPKTPDAVPLSQDEVDQFLASGRDARTYGITIYPGTAGTRFEFANRPRHVASTFIARTAALRDADLRPELLLIKAQLAPDFAGIELVCGFAAVHVSSFRVSSLLS